MVRLPAEDPDSADTREAPELAGGSEGSGLTTDPAPRRAKAAPPKLAMRTGGIAGIQDSSPSSTLSMTSVGEGRAMAERPNLLATWTALKFSSKCHFLARVISVSLNLVQTMMHKADNDDWMESTAPRARRSSHTHTHGQHVPCEKKTKKANG